MFEVLADCGKSHRARYFINGFHKTAQSMGFDSDLVPGYRGDAEWLVLWGVGGEAQLQAYRKHRAAGGRVLLADIGYFGRAKSYKASSFRISIDELHPQHLVQPEPPDRWQKHRIKMTEWHNPDGHILVCGMGPKSRVLYKHRHHQWEKRAILDARAAYPGTDVFFRSKPRYNERITGAASANNHEFDHWLKGAKLVITHHSNVSLDCAIHGVPCVTRDGIGAAYYGNDITSPVELSYNDRLNLLQSAAWWNWFPGEMSQMLRWLDQRYL